MTTRLLAVIVSAAGLCAFACGTADGASESSSVSPVRANVEFARMTDCPALARHVAGADHYDPSRKRLRRGALIVVAKSTRRLMLFVRGRLAQVAGKPACFLIGLAPKSPEGDKLREGDMRTPEGWYRTSDKPTSRWYGAIAVHYPNALDAKRGLDTKRISPATYRTIVRALKRGHKPPQQTPLGGEILVHGGGAADWTLGCVAMHNSQLDALRDALPRGMRTDMLIVP